MYAEENGSIELKDTYGGLCPVLGYGDEENDGIFLKESNQKIYICGSTWNTIKNYATGIVAQSFMLTYESLPVYLRIEVRGNAPAAFGYSTDGHTWKQVENLPVGAEDLLQWDRVARPGLYYQGPEGQAAEFEYMRMTNR